MSNIKLKGATSGESILKAPAVAGTDTTITLPKASIDLSTAGTDGQFLKTDGAGTLSFADAGSPSIDDNGNATAMTIDSSENIGIGTATPSSWNSDADNLVINSSGNAGITINTGSAGSTSAGNLVFAEGTGGDADKYRGAIKYTHGSDNLTFHVNNAEKMELQSDGDLKLESGNVIVNTAGKGILFHAHSSPANLLDDYEEGAWTPTIEFSGNAVGVTYSGSGQQGTYTKIGRQITVHAHFQLTSKGSSTGYARLKGMPFSVATRGSGSLGYYDSFDSGVGEPIMLLATSTTDIVLMENNDSASPDLVESDFTNTSRMYFTMTYDTDT